MTQLVNGVWGEEDTLYLAESLGWDEGWYFDGITKTDRPVTDDDPVSDECKRLGKWCVGHKVVATDSKCGERRALDFLKAAVRWMEIDGGFTPKEVQA